MHKAAYPISNSNSLKEVKLDLIINEEISPLGKLISKLPTEPIQGLAIYTGYKLNCAKEIMMIVSI